MLKDISDIKRIFAICIPVIFLVVGIMVIESFSQVEKGEHKIVITPYTPVEGIQSGYVIAYGHYLKAPYEVGVMDGKIYVNEVQMYMLKPTKPSKIPLDRYKDYEQAQELDSLIVSKYGDWEKERGSIEAQELILKFLEEHASVRESKIENDILYVTYKNGLKTKLWLWTVKEARERKIAPEEKETRLENEANRIIDSIKKDRLIIFGYGYCKTEPRGKDVFAKVKEIMDKDITISQKKNLLQNLLGHSGMVNEILYNF